MEALKMPSAARCHEAVKVLDQMCEYMRARGCEETASNYFNMARDLEDDLRAAKTFRPGEIDQDEE